MSPKPEEDWTQVARSDPRIVQWFAALTRGTQTLDRIPELLKRDKSYNYKAAIEAGLRPSLQADGTYHWPSNLPDGGSLKAKTHSTKNMGIGPVGWADHLK